MSELRTPDALSRLRRLAQNPLFSVATVHCNELLVLVECAEAVVAEARSTDVQSDMIAGEKIMLAYRQLEAL